jgi:hypothetical protein
MHRPESWGYVQFSTGEPGSAVFVRDRSLPARRWLQQVYYAQREFHKVHARWARTLDELRLAPPLDDTLAGRSMHATSSLFQATVELRLPDGRVQRWNIRQDALIWVESP